jgi:hypothetical protein
MEIDRYSSRIVPLLALGVSQLALARAAWLASKRNAVQDQQAHKNGRQRQTKHLCSPMLTCIKHLCSCALICLCHEVGPCISIFSTQKIKRDWAAAPAYGRCDQSSKGTQNYT